MKTIISIIILLVVAIPSYACDEECRKQAAEKKYNVEFAGYLSRKYCSDIATEFMTSTMKSLQNYRFNHLGSKHRGGMNNTNKFIMQRSEWLEECDNYLKLTDYGRVFKDKATTQKIMSAMSAVKEELDALIQGATYSNTEDSTIVAGEKFDRLFKLVDHHKTLLLLKGQFVTR
jgi:hypothetical protein